MPNRILRDWTDSETINQISIHAERLFIRLIMKADDYGNYPSNVKIIRAGLFPLLLDQVREADISRFLLELQEAGLVRFYNGEGKEYINILNFKQRLDKARRKYPPEPFSTDSVDMDNEFPAEDETKRSRNRNETETETDVEGTRVRSATTSGNKVLKKIFPSDLDAKFQGILSDQQYCESIEASGKISKEKIPELLQDFKSYQKGHHPGWKSDQDLRKHILDYSRKKQNGKSTSSPTSTEPKIGRISVRDHEDFNSRRCVPIPGNNRSNGS